MPLAGEAERCRVWDLPAPAPPFETLERLVAGPSAVVTARRLGIHHRQCYMSWGAQARCRPQRRPIVGNKDGDLPCDGGAV